MGQPMSGVSLGYNNKAKAHSLSTVRLTRVRLSHWERKVSVLQISAVHGWAIAGAKATTLRATLSTIIAGS